MGVIHGIKAGIVIRVMALVVIALGYASASAAGLDERQPDLAGSLTADAALFRGDAARTGEQTGPGPKVEPKELWQVVSDGWVFSSAIVADHVVYVNDSVDSLLALDVATGEELWRFPTGGSDSPPAIVDGVVFVGAALNPEQNGALYALDALTGEELWSYATPFPIYDSAPAVVDGVVFVGAEEPEEERYGVLHAVDAETGEDIWTIETNMPIVSSPAVVDGVVYVGAGGYLTETGAVYAVEAATGEELWTFTTVEDPVTATPAVVDGVVYAAGLWGFYALDAATGKPVWSIDDDDEFFDVSPAVADGRVYVGGTHLAALDAETGEEIWAYEGVDNLISSPVLADGVIYAGTYGGEIVAVDAADGHELWRFQVDVDGDADNRNVDNSPAVVDGVLYFTSFDFDATQAGGAIHAIGLPE